VHQHFGAFAPEGCKKIHPLFCELTCFSNQLHSAGHPNIMEIRNLSPVSTWPSASVYTTCRCRVQPGFFAVPEFQQDSFSGTQRVVCLRAFSQASSAHPLTPDSLRSLQASSETISLFGPQGFACYSTCVFATKAKICTGGGSREAHAFSFYPTSTPFYNRKPTVVLSTCAPCEWSKSLHTPSSFIHFQG